MREAWVLLCSVAVAGSVDQVHEGHSARRVDTNETSWSAVTNETIPLLVLKNGHSGSTWFGYVLNALPLAFVQAESISKKTSKRYLERPACLAEHVTGSLRAPLPKIQDRHLGSPKWTERLARSGKSLRVVGLTMNPMSEAAPFGVLGGIERAVLAPALAAVPRARVIFWYRSNVIKVTLSSSGSHGTNSATDDDDPNDAAPRGTEDEDGDAGDDDAAGTRRRGRRLGGGGDNGTNTEIDVDSFSKDLAVKMERNSAMLALRRSFVVAPSSTLLLAYEELQLDFDGATARIVAHLGLAALTDAERAALRAAGGAKRGSEDLREKLANFDELDAALGAPPWHSACLQAMLRSREPEVFAQCELPVTARAQFLNASNPTKSSTLNLAKTNLTCEKFGGKRSSSKKTGIYLKGLFERLDEQPKLRTIDGSKLKSKLNKKGIVFLKGKRRPREVSLKPVLPILAPPHS